jgi:D-alanyl-lipoteichoic acid acyltransferase DltB (MBOAT superfamily)
MPDFVQHVLMFVGLVYLTLHVYVVVGDSRRRRQVRQATDSAAFARFVEAMKRIEDEDQA